MKPTKRALIEQTITGTTIAPSWLFTFWTLFNPHLGTRICLHPANHILDINFELRVTLQISRLLIVLLFHLKQSRTKFDADTSDIVKSLRLWQLLLHLFTLYLLNNIPPLNKHGLLLYLL